MTNAVRHAGRAPATITLALRPDALELDVADDGGGGRRANAGGHGLTGMRERAALFGGTLDAGRARGRRVRGPRGAARTRPCA